MWGSTTPNTNTTCDWTNAPFNNGLDSYNESYFNSVKGTVCPNGILAKGYDAASQIMGGDWRMPTKDEIQELIDNTTNKWFTNYNGSGVNGRKFTSKINGNTIFIPAAGINEDSSVSYVGEFAYLWSSSLNTSDPECAWYWAVEDSDYHMYNGEWRYFGYTVRGIL